jgi:hypothetical protein
MLESLDNSDGIQYYGGNDPSKMSGRFKKGGGRGSSGSATASSARRSAVGQRSSVESKFGAFAANVAKQQAVLKDRNSTPDQREAAKRKLVANTNNARGLGNFGMGSKNMATFQGQ